MDESRSTCPRIQSPPALMTIITTTLLILTLSAPPPALAADPLPDVTITPDLVLGDDASAEAYILGSISSVVEDSRGNIYVADGSQHALLKFSPDGELLGSLTAVGEGPGDVVSHPVLGIDGQDRLHVAGQGGRVQLLDTEFRHVASFERLHVLGLARALAIDDEGRVAIAALDTRRHTTIDLYDAQGRHLRSFCDSYAMNIDIPERVESVYGGGEVARGPGGNLLYLQMAPYLVRVLDADGNVLRETGDGAADFVPAPDVPEMKDGRMTFRMPGASTGIAAAADGRVLVSALRRHEDGSTRSSLCLYDADLALLARNETDGLTMVVGQGAGGRVYLSNISDEGTRVLRASVQPAGTPADAGTRGR